jgi:hypothetical protein
MIWILLQVLFVVGKGIWRLAAQLAFSFFGDFSVVNNLIWIVRADAFLKFPKFNKLHKLLLLNWDLNRFDKLSTRTQR